MTIRKAYQNLNLEDYPTTVKMNNPMFDIDFYNGIRTDETQFTILGLVEKKAIIKELTLLFKAFCKDNGYRTNSVESITYVGSDPYYD